MPSKKTFSLEINDFKTVNTRDSPPAMEDYEMPVLLNYMPIGTQLYTVPSYTNTAGAMPNGVTAVRAFYCYLSGTYSLVVFGSDGALYKFDVTTWARTVAFGAGTFTNPQFAQWKTTHLLIIDPTTYGFWSYDGTYSFYRGGGQQCTITIASPAVITANGHAFSSGQAIVFTTNGALPTGLTAGVTYYVMSAGLTANSFQVSTIPGGIAVNTSGSQSGTQWVNTGGPANGTAIAVWKGRVFIGAYRTIYYSAPDSLSDFYPVDSGGSVMDNYASLGDHINAFASTQDYLYVIGDHGTHVIAGIQVYSTGSTIFNIIDALPKVGTIYPDTVQVFADSVYFLSDMGVWEVSAGSSRMISSYLDGLLPRLNTAFLPSAFFAKIWNKSVYCILVSVTSPIDGSNQKWLMCYYEQRWFFVYHGFDTTCAITKLLSNDTVSYAFYGQSIARIFYAPDMTNAMLRKLRTKSFTFGMPIHDKQVLWFGASISSPAGLQAPMTATMQAIGGGNMNESSSGTNQLTFPIAGVDIFNINNVSVSVINNVSAPVDITSTMGDTFQSVDSKGGQGKRIQLDFEETSNNQYILNGLFIGGQVGPDL